MRRFRVILAGCCLVVAAGAVPPVWAEGGGLRTWFSGGDAEPLPPDEAFRVSVVSEADGSAVRVHWDIEEGYYLYRDNLSAAFAADAPVRLAAYTLAPGVLKVDPEFGEVEVYYQALDLRLPLEVPPSTPVEAMLQLQYRGCKENSVCYPLLSRQFPVVWTRGYAAAAPAGAAGAADTSTMLKPGDPEPLALLVGGNMWATLGSFFLLGLLLAFTPCVFPMLPILSAMVAGERGASSTRVFMLTLVYVLAIAGTYAVLGLVAGWAGLNLQIAAQSAWLIVPFSVVLMLLALAMFGVYQLQWPQALRDRLAVSSLPGGSWSGAALLGLGSAVLAGPCVAPPVLAAMLYIGRTGDGGLGALSLFSMGLGFGVPLLILGTSLGSLLPRAGAWMVHIRHLLGVLILAVTIVFLGRVLPGPLVLLAWGALSIGCALYLGPLKPAAALGRYALPGQVVGWVLLVYGVALVIGAAGGATNPLRPLQQYHAASPSEGASETDFHRVYTLAELEQQLQSAQRLGRPTLVDVYADWCVECKRLERTFNTPEVRAALSGVLLIKADITRNTPDARALLAHFELYGPPAVLFFGEDMRELRVYRLYEYAGPAELAQRVRRAFAS